ncbi:helix-turn-helix domain-containing protein [Vibrio nigripulchritudo]|uniref:helix-turn-helix domain-containing protein n=1 Tax=Vibrio nigripulchritudo TaxID=28173 RepID=UPI0003B1EB70|nr:AraC family transcriptional regulator [Vibrio nigripulchritudo]CCN72494.1 hypothetical protein VIBNISFn118_600004 [Vibrio nigripulchritudo SFn118]
MLLNTYFCDWRKGDVMPVDIEESKSTKRQKTSCLRIDQRILMIKTEGAPNYLDFLDIEQDDRVILVYVASERSESKNYTSKHPLKVFIDRSENKEIERQLSYIEDDDVVISLIVAREYIEQLVCENCLKTFFGEFASSTESIASSSFNFLPHGHVSTILHQLVETNSYNELQTLFAQAKVYELLSLTLDNMGAELNTCTLSKSDIARLHQARDLLEQNLISPPSLIDLAHEVGINDFKLKKGFRELFQITPYAYLRHYRMTVAQNMLARHDMSVSAVANAVGYNNLGHFAKAFRKQFGLKPKDFKQQQRMLKSPNREMLQMNSACEN